jgi:beta-galactosidase
MFEGRLPWAGTLLHGADYNYEQWLDFPAVLDTDMDYMREAAVNVLSVGIFSWSMLESSEGVYHFDWLDKCFDRLYKNGQRIILATPSGSKPAWLSEKYPAIRQMTPNGERHPHGGRHNHCRTSPEYREACVRINTKLAERYGSHPALILWHVSNEYNGSPCYCPLCLAAFREWLKNRYQTLDALNAVWYTRFWSHCFTSWEQIFPADHSIHGMMIDWQRFTSDQTIDFFLAESGPLRRITPNIPVTTNFQMPDVGLDYHTFSRYVDVISFDNYPEWHRRPSDEPAAVKAGFFFDLCRSFKSKPFLMMESSPGAVNWQGVSKKKREGMHQLSSLQAIAHGSDSVLYFQWRQSRGGYEKFHDAVVTHIGDNQTRIFRDVKSVGAALQKLAGLAGSDMDSSAAVVYDFQNGWALEEAMLQRSIEKNYQNECIAHYGAFWKAGISCDVIDPEAAFEKYKLIVFPMLYLLRETTAARIRAFIQNGGIVAATYLTGMVNESDLCYLEGAPGGLTDVFGIAVEETETIADYENRQIAFDGQIWKVSHYADFVRLQGAQPLAAFCENSVIPPEEEQAALTVRQYGKGFAYYLCARTGQEFLNHLYRSLCAKHGISSCVPWEIPAGVSIQQRGDAVFVMNFNPQETAVFTGGGQYYDLLSGGTISGTVKLPPYGAAVLSNRGC